MAEAPDPRLGHLLVAALSADDPAVRGAAAAALGRLADGRHAEPLARLLGDPDPKLVTVVVRALGELRQPPAIPQLTAALGRPEVRLRQAAAESLARTGDPGAVDPLVRAVADPDAAVHRAAVAALAALGEGSFESVAYTTGDDFRRRAAARDERVLLALLDAARRGELARRRDAINVLAGVSDARATEAILEALQDPVGEVRQAACPALAQTSGANAEPLRTRRVEALTAAVADPDQAVRAAACVALADLWSLPDESLAVVVGALGDPDTMVRTAALGALAKVRRGGPGDQAPHFIGHRSAAVRRAALQVLVERRDPRGFPPLAQAVDTDPEADLRVAAIEGLGGSGDQRALGPLWAALLDSDAAVRLAAAEGLARLGDDGPGALVTGSPDDVERLCTGDDPWVREAAHRAVGSPLPERRLNAVAVLTALAGPDTVEPLIVALRDRDPDVRRAAASALGRCADPQAIDPLALALRDQADPVAVAAAESLQSLGDARAAEPLSRVLLDPGHN
ncbi:MAG: HEAT repeat domain-containing protein, partial [Armatimonadetes bacterium]|nr:HEAT repeat domain-containing protein [Armatimonadota bacterium]